MISIEQYRATIGTFYSHVGMKSFNSSMYFWSFVFPNFFFYNWVLPNLILMAGDIEENPGPMIKDNVHIGYVNIWSLLAPVRD